MKRSFTLPNGSLIEFGFSISETHIHCYGNNLTYENYIKFGYMNNKFANYMADCLETLLDTFRKTVKS